MLGSYPEDRGSTPLLATKLCEGNMKLQKLRVLIFSYWLRFWVDLLPNYIGTGCSDAFAKLQGRLFRRHKVG